MDVLQETDYTSKKTFINHVFSTTEESKAEIMNVVQYAVMGLVPILTLNKLVQRFIPEADTDTSTLELLVEIFIQLVIMFCGIIIVHRMITYFPTYSGFKYESLTLTNVILAFLVIILSIQTKLGLKMNILFDRAMELWNGPSNENQLNVRKKLRPVQQHAPSQADYLDDNGPQGGVFPPAPQATAKNNQQGRYDHMMGPENDFASGFGPMAANGVLGGSFGATF